MDHSAYKLLKLPISEVTVRTTYCLLCRWSNYILQPLYSESCHQETIAIALPQLVFKVISRFCCLWWLIYMPEGLSEMSRFSKVSSIFGRDAFATMRYVTLLNVSEIRDISNDERKVPFKNDDYLASGTSSFRRACKSIIRDNKI